MSKKRRFKKASGQRSRATTAAIHRFVEHAIEVTCEGQGCPRCGAQTTYLASNSAEFPDLSVVVNVVHACQPCGCTHHTVIASGGVALNHVPSFVEKLKSEGATISEAVKH
jgi:hypothetical protein